MGGHVQHVSALCRRVPATGRHAASRTALTVPWHAAAVPGLPAWHATSAGDDSTTWYATTTWHATWDAYAVEYGPSAAINGPSDHHGFNARCSESAWHGASSKYNGPHAWHGSATLHDTSSWFAVGAGPTTAWNGSPSWYGPCTWHGLTSWYGPTSWCGPSNKRSSSSQPICWCIPWLLSPTC